MKFLRLRAPSWERRGLPMATAQFTTAAAARRFGVGVKPGYRINPHFACKMNNTCATRHTHQASGLLTCRAAAFCYWPRRSWRMRWRGCTAPARRVAGSRLWGHMTGSTLATSCSRRW